MIAKIVEFSVRNRYLVILAWLAVAIWGIYAVLHTPVDAIPDLSENQVIVFADWMGRSPQDIEEQITYPLSVQLQGLAGVKAVRASSEFNFSMINVIFDEKTDFYFARQRVQERLATAQAQMPAGVIPYMAPDATALGQIFWYTVEGGKKSLDELRAIQDYTVRYQLASVPGVSEVASVGGMVREYQVDVDPARLRAFDLSLGQLYAAIGNSNLSVGGKVIVENSSEYLVRGTGWLRGVDDLEKVVIASRAGVPIQLKQVAKVQLGPEFRRSALEKNGREVTGGVVMMRFGENPLRVTEAIKKKIVELQPGLPEGVRVVPFYDRTQLIESAIHTVTGTLKEEMIIASIAILLILSHFRSAVVVCITLPMAVLVSFLFMYYLKIPSNIMSLCGIAISIGILVDAAVVMVENASHELKVDAESKLLPGKKHAAVTGDTTEIVVRACRLVGRPIFFSVLIMLISFLPVFSFGGQEGKLSHPLAYTKSFAMIGVALLAISFVPALIPILIRGRIRGEEENWIVRSFIHIYKPTISWIIDRPAIVWWIMAVILAIGAGLLGTVWLTFVALAFGLVSLILGVKKDGWTFWLLVALLAVIFAAMGIAGLSTHEQRAGELLGRSTLIIPIAAGAITLLAMIFKHWRTAALTSFLVIAFVADTKLIKLGSEFMPTLNEGSILDMPTSAPRIAMGQAVDDIMIRDRILRSYPEVDQVVGKVGRADTATDPSPLDMVETVITLRPTDWWPKRKIRWNDTVMHASRVARALSERGILKTEALAPTEWPMVAKALQDAKFLEQNPKYTTASEMLNMAASTAAEKFDVAMRTRAIARQKEYEPKLSHELMAVAYDALIAKAGKAIVKVPTETEREAIIASCAAEHGVHMVEVPRQEEVDKLLTTLRKSLADGGFLADRVDLLMDESTALAEAKKFVSRAMGFEPANFSQRLLAAIEKKRDELWQANIKTLNWELFDYGTGMVTNLLADSIVVSAKGTSLQGVALTDEVKREISESLTPQFAKDVFLWHKTKDDILKEMDSELQMPGWGNAWTQPIINRVNMLATGVRTQIGVKVFGPTGKPLDASIDDIQKISEEIAAKLKTVRGAVDVIADQAVGKRYLEVQIDRDKAARYGVNMSDVAQAIEVALGGAKVTTTIEGRQRFPVRLRYAQEDWQDLSAVKNVLVIAQTTPAELLNIGSASGAAASGASPMGGAGDAMKSSGAKSAGGMGGGMGGGGNASPAPTASVAKSSGGDSLQLPAPGSSVVQIPLSMVADIKVIEGPSMIKSENGRLRNYVTLNVRDRDILSFVEEARSAIAPIEAKLAGTGMSVEWSGEFEHQVRANQTLAIIFPMVIVVILFLLYITFHDMLDTLLASLAVAGALCGALMMQSLFGFNRSVIVSIGYIAAFGMATQTAVIMLVYLREAIDKRGGLDQIKSIDELRTAVIEGAVHRLRPKLLTEGVAIVGLVPMLWATGTGAEIMRPMAAPVLGGLLISDEVVDLMIPILFYWIRRKRWEKLNAKAEPQTAKQTEGILNAEV